MIRKYARNKGMILWLIIFFSQSAAAQTEEQKLSSTILTRDSLFWITYNNCDTTRFKNFFTDDVEFYHDKGGLTLGLEALATSFRQNLCSNNDFKLRREAVEGTVKVFPLQKSGAIYGAVISGEHLFYIVEKGKERLDGHARFTHVWILNEGNWKMSRIISYDHGPAPYINKKKEIRLPANSLTLFTGKYKSAQTGVLIIKKENDLLALVKQDKKSLLYPETPNLFFMKERDLSFEFIKSGKNKDYKLRVRENGEIVDELIMEHDK